MQFTSGWVHAMFSYKPENCENMIVMLSDESAVVTLFMIVTLTLLTVTKSHIVWYALFVLMVAVSPSVVLLFKCTLLNKIDIIVSIFHKQIGKH